MAYIGNTQVNQNYVAAIDYFSGNGSTTAFTLSRPVASVAQVQVVIENVPQNPGDAYTVNGNTITFTSAPPSGTNNIYVYYTSPNTQVTALPQSPIVYGNLNFGSTGARIQGDFSNATIANRLAFQTSTTNEATTFEIIPNGTGTGAAISLESSSTATNCSTAQLVVSDGSDARFTSGIRGTGTYLPMTFYTGGSERMRIDSSGNVGIGTNSPAAQYSLTTQSRIYVNNQNTDMTPDASWTGQITARGNGYNGGIALDATGMWVGHNSATRALLFATDETERMRITDVGEVWIAGTTDRGAFNLQCNGTGVWGAGAYTNGSDARIKDDITPLDSGLDVVEKLNPVTYKYKEDWSKDQSIQTGFIAQDLLVALEGKEYVDGIVNQSSEYMSVAYQNIIPILTKAIQELKAIVDEQAEKIKALEAK